MNGTVITITFASLSNLPIGRGSAARAGLPDV